MILVELCFSIVFLLGTLVVWTCLVAGADADVQAEKMFEKYRKEKEQENSDK